jgi:hypothetical protein
VDGRPDANRYFQRAGVSLRRVNAGIVWAKDADTVAPHMLNEVP